MTGDVDGDGDLDLLTANIEDNTVSVRLNGGNAAGSNTGTFSNGSEVAVGRRPISLALGDVDRDGDLDVVTANTGDNSVSVRLNGGDATGSNTGIFSNGSDVPVGRGTYDVVLGDVNADGYLDLLTANATDVTVSVCLNAGNAAGATGGTFLLNSSVAVTASPYALVVGDIDGDGDLDVLTANYNVSNVVSVRLNGGDATGSNTGVFSGGSDVAVGSRPISLALGDVDGDGDLDLATANFGGTVGIRLNGGDATGSNTGLFSNGSNPTTGPTPRHIALADVDGDGDLDITTVNFGTSPSLNVRLNGGDATGSNTGAFSNGGTLTLPIAAISMALADLDGDGDGDLDALTTDYNSGNAPGNTASASLNGSIGLATAAGVIPVGLALSPNPAHGAVTLTGAAPNAPLAVLDALGRVLLTATADATGAARLALPEGLSAGVYLVRSGEQVRRLAVE